MERQSDAADRVLDAQCGSPASAHSRRAVVRLAAMRPDDSAYCIVKYMRNDLGNLVRCAISAGVSADTLWDEVNAPILCVAAQRGHARALKSLLAGGANHALADAIGNTAAHNAASCGRTACLRLLLEAGAQLEAKSHDDSTPLLLAAWQGRADTCRLLLNAGASVATCDDVRRTPLHLAAKEGHLAVVNMLVAAGAELEAAGDRMRTPLGSAASEGHAEVVAALLARGANPNAVSDLGDTPLMDAIGYKKTGCVAALLQVTDLSITNVAGNNAFHRCVLTANEECFSLLLPHYSDVDVRTVRNVGDSSISFNVTALHLACEKGQHKMAKMLLRRGASRMALDSARCTPLHYAAELGHLSCLNRLLGSPGDFKLTPDEVNALNDGGCAALHLAALVSQTHCCGALLAAGARLDVTAASGRTALMMAQRDHPTNTELIALLSGSGHADAPGTTCYHCGAREADARLRYCSGCYYVRYCGAACLQAAWPAHKEECRRLQAAREARSTPSE